MTACDSSPLHPPAIGEFRTLNNGDAIAIPLCGDCLRPRIAAALDHQEHFEVRVPVEPETRAMRYLREIGYQRYPRHLMSDL